MLNLPELNSLLDFDQPTITLQFSNQYQVSAESSNQLFKDLLGWMWLSIYRQHNRKKTHLFGSLLTLDNMWHIFILNTRIYHEFCTRYFGGYFHHEIEMPGNEKRLTKDELFEFISDCYEHLGRDWVERNFADVLAGGNSK